MKDKLITKSTFPYIIGFTALLIALCAAFFSVYGIGNLFAGAAISAMIMAGSLEIGKLVATTFLYRYWQKSIGLIKVYLTLAVIALMIITSAGIFGFLSSAYQKSSLDYKLNQDRIASIESSKGYYTNQVKSSEQRVKILNDVRGMQEARLSEALTNTFLSRNPIQLQQLQQQTIKLIDQANVDIKAESDKIEQSRNQMMTIDEKINQMKIGATEKKDIQTFRFLADALHTDLDTVAKWFIVSLIFVFDPLAIALILAYNVVVYKPEEEKLVVKEEPMSFKEEEPVIISGPVKIQKVEESPTIIQKTEEVVEPEKVNTIIKQPSKEVISIPKVKPFVSTEPDDFFKRMFKK